MFLVSYNMQQSEVKMCTQLTFTAKFSILAKLYITRLSKHEYIKIISMVWIDINLMPGSRLDTLVFGLYQLTPIRHFCYKYPQTPALSEHGHPPHFTASRYSFCSTPHGLLHWLPISDRIDFKIATLTYKTLLFWPSGVPS